MITSKNIRAIFENMEKGVGFTSRNIQIFLGKNYELETEDWKPHTKTRPTSYPLWRHRLQGVLAADKKKGIIKYNEIQNLYYF